MNAPPVPDRVWQFLAESIGNVPQLEALLLMWRERERTWSCAEVAASLHMPPVYVASMLEVLCNRGLLTGREDDKFQPAREPDATDLIGELAEAYRNHLIPITRFIHARQRS